MVSEQEILDLITSTKKEIKQKAEAEVFTNQDIKDEIEFFEEDLLEMGVSPNKVKQYVEELEKELVSETYAETYFRQIQPIPFKVFSNKRKISKKDLAERKLGKVEVVDLSEANEPKLRKLLSEMTTTGMGKITPTTPRDKILFENAKILLEELSEAAKYSRKYVRPKKVRVDSYLGGLPLGKMANRENIYDYWEEVYEKYEDVESTFKNLMSLLSLFPQNEEITKELKEFENKDLSYVAELDNVIVKRNPAVNVINNYMILLASVYGVSNELDKLIQGTEGVYDKLREFESHGNRLARLDPTTGEVKDASRELAEDTETKLDDELIYADDDKWPTRTDPLLAYYFARDRNSIVAFTKEKYEELVKIFNDAIENAIAQPDGEQILYTAPSIKREINRAKDTFTISRDKYYLPKSVFEDSVFANIEDYRGMKEEYRPQDISDFLLAVGKLLWEIEPTFPKRSPKSAISQKDYQIGEMVGRVKGEVKVKTALKSLLEEIEEYYIVPSYSGRLTIGEVDFTKSRGAKLIAAGANRLGIQNITGKAYNRLLDKTFIIPPRAITKIYNFLNEVLTGGGDLGRQLIQKGEMAATALSEIFAGKGSDSILSERTNNHMAAIITYLYEEAGKQDMNVNELTEEQKKEVIGEKMFKGKTLLERSEQYEEDYKSGKAFPLFALPSFLKMYEKDIARSKRSSENLGRLRVLLDEIEDLPIVMKSLLKAHDVLRIMKNEDIVVAYRPRNIIHYDEVIVKMYHEQNIDLSHSEVEKIVSEVDSFSSIAKAMGISEEVVYQVKAQFR